MNVTRLADWYMWMDTGDYTVLPFVKRVDWEGSKEMLSLASWEEAWRQATPESFVLESGKGGRYTFLGIKPQSIIRGTIEEAEIWGVNQAINNRTNDDNQMLLHDRVQMKPLQAVKQWMKPYISPKVTGAPKFIGGCVGFWGYDVVRSLERLPLKANRDVEVPDYAFGLYNQVWVIDHEQSALYIAVHTNVTSDLQGSREAISHAYDQAEQASFDMLAQWEQFVQSTFSKELRQAREELFQNEKLARDEQLDIDMETLPNLTRAFPREEFEQAVEKIQAYIAQGDVFQVNLSVRQSSELQSSAEHIYEWLRIINPSPYMGLMRFRDFTLVSASPELLVQLEDSKLRTRPIAGTRPRGNTPQEDQKLADELISNDKERAEHVMLVDLERNDLGRISKFGSVKVDEFMVIEYYSHVMHIVTEVQGELAENKDAFDVIAATFPGGTITGAPKVRTMEIIEELEPVGRGPYTGSMGWIDYNGDMEFNIIIRTLLAKQGIGYVQAGAGIVIDSVPAKEYTESLNKAKAIWKAIKYSEYMTSRVKNETQVTMGES